MKPQPAKLLKHNDLAPNLQRLFQADWFFMLSQINQYFRSRYCAVSRNQCFELFNVKFFLGFTYWVLSQICENKVDIIRVRPLFHEPFPLHMCRRDLWMFLFISNVKWLTSKGTNKMYFIFHIISTYNINSDPRPYRNPIYIFADYFFFVDP